MNNYELYHHGIRGQRWGVRHGPPYPLKQGTSNRIQKHGASSVKPKSTKPKSNSKQDGVFSHFKNKKIKAQPGAYSSQGGSKSGEGWWSSLSPAKKTAIVAAGVAGVAVVGGLLLKSKANKVTSGLYKKPEAKFDPYTPFKMDDYSNEIKTVTKGTLLQRVSSRSTEDYSAAGERMYASFLQSDNAAYKFRMPSIIRETTGSSKNFVYDMTLKKDIKIASDRDVRECFKEAMKRVNGGKVTAESDPSLHYDSESIFQSFMKGDFRQGGDNAEAFKRVLREKGFDAIVDYSDLDKAKMPLVILNPTDVIDKSVKVHKLGNVERVISLLRS